MFFKCEICGNFYDVEDTTNNICLNCIDYYCDKYGYIFDLLPPGYEPCNADNCTSERCSNCIWSNHLYCAYKVMCVLRNRKQQGN